MSSAFDFAKYLIKQGMDTNSNTIDGNMKLQKLLTFANLISLAELDEPLFEEEITAFVEGCVIEPVRLRYRNDYRNFVEESNKFVPEFTQSEYDVLNLAVSILGKLSARELSNLNHSFAFWRDAYNNSVDPSGYKDKRKAVVTVEAMRGELDRVRVMVKAFRDTQEERNLSELINGVQFIYSPDTLTFDDDVVDQLYEFSLLATDPAYSVYIDGGELVVY